jgi:ERO1-like protein alpha
LVFLSQQIILKQAEDNIGNPEDDLKTQSLVKQLLYHPKLRSACPKPFDEASSGKGENGPELEQEIQKQFRNIRFVTYFHYFQFITCICTT